jgi:hypothetical protein
MRTWDAFSVDGVRASSRLLDGNLRNRQRRLSYNGSTVVNRNGFSTLRIASRSEPVLEARLLAVHLRSHWFWADAAVGARL